MPDSKTPHSPRSAHDLVGLRHDAETCTACDLHEWATQTVFGEGPERAPLVVVGEQPGDHEDRSGHPFVGPAGRVLDRALDAAGIARDLVYVTNAVKHFKFESRGKVRIHKKPNAAEVRACAQWWHAELAEIEPRVVVALGATAAQAMLGPDVRVTRDRGILMPAAVDGFDAIVTIHPSAVLRASGDARERLFDQLVADLRAAASAAGL
jgi:uracil-DNA glycosylase family protein